MYVEEICAIVAGAIILAAAIWILIKKIKDKKAE